MLLALFRLIARLPLAWLQAGGALLGLIVYLASAGYRGKLRANLARAGYPAAMRLPAARAAGAMVAIELFVGGDHKKPAAELTGAIVRSAAKRGLILLSCGVYANVIRILVPLVATDAQLDEGLGSMAACFDTLA